MSSKFNYNLKLIIGASSQIKLTNMLDPRGKGFRVSNFKHAPELKKFFRIYKFVTTVLCYKSKKLTPGSTAAQRSSSLVFLNTAIRSTINKI